MKRTALLILVYIVALTALVATVKLAQSHAASGHGMLADCNDPPPPTPGGE